MKKALFCFLGLCIPLASQAQDCDCVYPIIFVHGFYGNENSWLNFSQELEFIWGNKIIIPDISSKAPKGTVYYANLNSGFGPTSSEFSEDVILHYNFTNAPEILQDKCIYAISFDTKFQFDVDGYHLVTKLSDTYDEIVIPSGESDSNAASAYKQGYALGKMIETVLSITGKDKVILVGHSMGGLTIREYLQRRVEPDPSSSPQWWVYPDELDGHRVAKVFTVGTPHRGSNIGAAIDDYINYFDPASEAVRDLRYSFSPLTPVSAPYLYSGPEENCLFNDPDPHNTDINCNGNPVDPNIFGINASGTPAWAGSTASTFYPLPTSNIKYTYYVGNTLHGAPCAPPSFYGCLGDGVVSDKRQWLYEGGDGSTSDFHNGLSKPFPSNFTDYFLADRITSPKSVVHFEIKKETDDFEHLMRGLDEADFPYFAWEVQLATTYKGLIQKRADRVAVNSNVALPQSTGTNDPETDTDWYKLKVKPEEVGSYNLVFTKIPGVAFQIDFFKDQPDDLFSNAIMMNDVISVVSSENEFDIINIDLGTLATQEYFLRITGKNRDVLQVAEKTYSFQISKPTNCQANLKYRDHSVQINTTKVENRYVLHDLLRGIVTYNAHGQSDKATNFSDDDCIWENTNEEDVGTDIHWALGKAYDLVVSELGYPINFSITAFANYELEELPEYSNNTNAFGDIKSNVLFFGKGDPDEHHSLPMGSLDLVAHEFFHLVLNDANKLKYVSQSGALNEGYCDIFGKYLEYKVRELNSEDSFSWTFGKENFVATADGIRSLENPLYDGRPDVFQGKNNWLDLTECALSSISDFIELTDESDNCGVHTNSGPLNRWFYLLCEGGKGKNSNLTFYEVKKIGIDRAANIAFTTLFNELQLFSGYQDLFEKSVEVAEDLYGICSDEANSVKNAWYAVGIGEPGIMVDQLDLTPASCQVADGEASIAMVQGNQNYSFLWDNGQTGTTTSGLSKGNHTITVTEIDGETCAVTIPFVIEEELSFSTSIDVEPNTNCNSPNGQATIIVKDKTSNTTPANLQIIWQDSDHNEIAFQTTQVQELAAGQYTAVIQDTETGCTENLTFEIQDKLPIVEIRGGGNRTFCEGNLPPQIKLYPEIQDCNGCHIIKWETEDGTILEEAEDKSEILVAVQEATYMLTVKDETGCNETLTTTISLTEKDCLACDDTSLEFVQFTGVDPCKEFTVNVLQPLDPNEIIGPEGYGDPNWVSINDEIPYTVLFENDPEFAMASASRVEIQHYFDDKVNAASLRLGDFGFANLSFTIPKNRSFYQERLDATDSLGVFVDVLAGIDLASNKAFWILEAIDPATGQPPLNPDLGLLPINDTITRRGEGFVNFSLRPVGTAQTGDTLFAQANIIFDQNEPITTNTHFNLIDAVPPTSALDSLPALLDTTAFSISWSGADDTLASGLKVYNLYVAENQGPFLLYQSNMVDTSLIFKGQKGNTYEFYTRAIDNTGNIEKSKEGISVTIKDDLQLAAKVLLQGPYDSLNQLMTDQLRSQGKLPLLEPYLELGFSAADGEEKIDTSVLLVTGEDAIVDWVFLELRDPKDYTLIAASRSALLQRDGDIVDVDGVSPVLFTSLKPDDYYVVVRHRNHLGVRSSIPLSLTRTPTYYDFSNSADQAAGINPLTSIGSNSFGLYAGNANFDSQINAVDKNAFWRIQNGQPFLYLDSSADFNLDGTVNAVDKNIYWRINNSIVEQLE